MAPITINRHNIFQWLKFGLLEIGRVIRALFTRSGGRVTAVTRFVEEHAECGNPDSVLDAIDTFSYEQRFLMNVGDEKGEILLRHLKEAKAANVLELGAYCGYSAVLMGKELASKGGRLVSIEASDHNTQMARRVVARAGLSKTVEFQVGKASERIDQLEGPFDLVFIDHWKDDYLSDLMRLQDNGLLRPGSRIVADNVGIFSKALEPYLSYVRESEEFHSIHYPTRMEYNDSIDDGVEVSIWRPSPDEIAA